MAIVRRRKGRRLGLALASGGMLGGVYEVGALRALEESIGGLDLNRLDAYVGVSAGAFVGSLLVNGITVTEMLRGLRAEHPGRRAGDLFDPAIFFVPALGEMRRQGLRLPWSVMETLTQVLGGPEGLSLIGTLEGICAMFPLHLFDNDPIQEYLRKVFTRPGRTNDFRRLARRFFVMATDLDTGCAVVFGEKGLDHVPISRAVQASTAVPGIYPPVQLEGHTCVDGVLLKTMHATLALQQGADLLFCVNPLVPWNADSADGAVAAQRKAIIRSGLPSLLSQCFRILIHSRASLGMERVAHAYPKADVLLFEPEATEHRLFTNLFRFRARHEICQIGYEQTRKDLWRRRKLLGPVLARHGLTLQLDILADPNRKVWGCLRHAVPGSTQVTEQLDAALRMLEVRYG